MKISDFVKLFDKKAIEDGRVSFTIYAGMDRGGKWTFWCEEGQTAENLIAFIESNECLKDLELDSFSRLSLAQSLKTL